MATVVSSREIAPGIISLVVEAPRVARKAQPGHFVVVRASEEGERIPLTIADSNAANGTITLVVQRVGKSTMEICALPEGGQLLDVLGPLGEAYPIRNLGTVVCVAGGVGAAPMLPKAKALKAAGNTIVTILGSQSESMLILEEELRACSDEFFITTNDGSKGTKGFVTGPLKEYLDAHKADEVIAIGPLPMMQAVCSLTGQYPVPTIVSLNSVMIDGTGMCGGCRVTVGGQVKFTCVDGPAFDGLKVDFAELAMRLRYYKDHEAVSRDKHECRIGLGGGNHGA